MPTVSKPRLRASASAASILAEPPLVEIPTAMSSGLACAMSWRAKIASVPMSLAKAVMLAGSAARETAGIVPQPGGGSTQSETRSFASVAEPPLPKVISFPPRSSRSDTAAAISEMALPSDSAAALRTRFTSCIFWSIQPCTSRTTSSRGLGRPLDRLARIGEREAHHHVLGLQHHGQATLELRAEVEGWQRPLANDHRVHELHRDVLRVGGRRTVPEGQEPSSCQEAAGHLVAGLCQPRRLHLEESLEDIIAPQQFLAALYSERVRIYLAHRLHLNPVKPASGEEFSRP